MPIKASVISPYLTDEEWRRKWQPSPVFMPGESHGRRSLVGYSPRGHKDLDTTERLHSLTSLIVLQSLQGKPGSSGPNKREAPWQPLLTFN